MKLTLTEPRLLTESINIISELVNEASFKVDKDKIELVAMDPANVALVNFQLLSSAFTEYALKENVEIALSLENLKQVLRRAKSTDTIVLSLDEGKNRLNINLKGETNRTFNIPLIEIEEKEQKIPQLKFSAKIETPATLIDEAIQDMEIIAESVTLQASKKQFTVRSENNLSDANVEIKQSEQNSINCKEDAKAKYSIEYLKKIIKGSKLTDTMTLQFSQDYPLKAEYLIKDKLYLSFILAPRIDND